MPKRYGAVHVAKIERKYKGSVYTSYLLRRSVREGNKVKHETLGNISHLPPDLIDIIRRRLQGEPIQQGGTFEIMRSYPHGHVAAVLSVLRDLKLDNLLASRPCRDRDVAVAMIVLRILSPGSKLASARALQEETATCSLALELGLEQVRERELYNALDWLLERQRRIENKLAKRHLQDGTLILYDVSSSYYTGHKSELVAFGHNRDGKQGFPQIVYGLLCNAEGCPIAIEVFPGNTADPKTFSAQVDTVRRRFGIQRVVFVGDRGMITSKRIDEDLRNVDGLDWITALRADSIQHLVANDCFQPSLLDERSLTEVTTPDYPGERLIVCRNPLLAAERTRKRKELLQDTQKKLDEIVTATRREKKPLRGEAAIGMRVGKVINQRNVAKHFIVNITHDNFSYQRDEASIAREQELDGIYVIRTSVTADTLDAENTVRAYKDLSKVERAFRSMKTIDLKVRPIHHWLDDRIRAHVFLCMLAYYVEFHLRQKLAPILFDDHEREQAEAGRSSIVDPAPRSDAAKQKEQTKRTTDDYPVLSFQTLLKHLATLNKNRVRVQDIEDADFFQLTHSTPLQQHVFELLGHPNLCSQNSAS